MRKPPLTLHDDPEEWERPLAPILLDLRAARSEYGANDSRIQDAAEGSDEHEQLGKTLDRLDVRIDQLRSQAKFAIERDTGVKWERIEEASL